LLLQG